MARRTEEGDSRTCRQREERVNMIVKGKVGFISVPSLPLAQYSRMKPPMSFSETPNFAPTVPVTKISQHLQH